MPSSTPIRPPSLDLHARWRAVRARTDALTCGLSDAEATGQSMPDASPAKWHLAHTTWFFETFLLRDHVPGHEAFDPSYAWLFNSYYEGEGPRLARDRRGRLIHPTLHEIRAYRAHVDAAMDRHFPHLLQVAADRIALGVAHEEQHQELLRMDLLHLAHASPLQRPMPTDALPRAPLGRPWWVDRDEGLVDLGAAPEPSVFDCETPRHRVWLPRHRIARALVTQGDWQAFRHDRGYDTPSLWLADGWAWRLRENVQAPLYWRTEDTEPTQIFTLDGWRPWEPTDPVMHVSHFEADAFARWAGARLPTEAEWEHAALEGVLDQAHDAAWQWTSSAFLPYPRFRAAAGTVGEYNGKFMSGQIVLRGGSIASPPGHTRNTYRNFFYPHQRWAFTGLRLAQDA